MNEYTVYLNNVDNESVDIIIYADSFEISEDKEYVYFKDGTRLVGFFKMCQVIGAAKEGSDEDDN